MTACTRNCWIFAALCGLLVWALAAGGVGVWAGLFLGFVTAWLLGGLMVLLFCEGRGGEAADARLAPPAARVTPLPEPLPDAPRIAEAARPAGMQGAPEGAGTAGAAVTFAAMPQAGGKKAADKKVAAKAADSAAKAVSFGAAEAKPVGASAPEKPVKDKKSKDKSEKKDKKSKDKSGKDKAAKADRKARDAAGAGATDVSPSVRLRAQADAPPPAMTLTAPLDDGAASAPQDDLGRIDGIGPKLTEWLNQNGITRFAQIAAWTPEETADWAARLGRWGGRIDSDDWIGQARILAAGGETAHSRRVDRGEST